MSLQTPSNLFFPSLYTRPTSRPNSDGWERLACQDETYPYKAKEGMCALQAVQAVGGNIPRHIPNLSLGRVGGYQQEKPAELRAPTGFRNPYADVEISQDLGYSIPSKDVGINGLMIPSIHSLDISNQKIGKDCRLWEEIVQDKAIDEAPYKIEPYEELSDPVTMVSSDFSWDPSYYRTKVNRFYSFHINNPIYNQQVCMYQTNGHYGCYTTGCRF